MLTIKNVQFDDRWCNMFTINVGNSEQDKTEENQELHFDYLNFELNCLHDNRKFAFDDKLSERRAFYTEFSKRSFLCEFLAKQRFINLIDEFM